MGKQDQGLAAAEGARRATGDTAGRGRGDRLGVFHNQILLLRGIPEHPRVFVHSFQEDGSRE